MCVAYKYGCTDVNAENYNASADTDNDSCVYDCFTAGSDYDFGTVTETRMLVDVDVGDGTSVTYNGQEVTAQLSLPVGNHTFTLNGEESLWDLKGISFKMVCPDGTGYDMCGLRYCDQASQPYCVNQARSNHSDGTFFSKTNDDVVDGHHGLRPAPEYDGSSITFTVTATDICQHKCTEEACDASTHVLKVDTTERCTSSICQLSDQSTCCDPRATCDSFFGSCSNETKFWDLSKTSVLCKDKTCTSEEDGDVCCSEKAFCEANAACSDTSKYSLTSRRCAGGTCVQSDYGAMGECCVPRQSCSSASFSCASEFIVDNHGTMCNDMHTRGLC